MNRTHIDRCHSHPRLPLQQFGDVRTLYTAAKSRGYILITYFDLRAAVVAKGALHGSLLHHMALEVHYTSLKSQSQGVDQVGLSMSHGVGILRVIFVCTPCHRTAGSAGGYVGLLPTGSCTSGWRLPAVS